MEDTSTNGGGGANAVDCIVSAWGDWGPWSDATNECGTRTRTRTVETPASGGGCDTGETTTTTSGGGKGGEGDNNDDNGDDEETPYLLYGLGTVAFLALLITLKK